MDITIDMAAFDGATQQWIEDEARRTSTSVEAVITQLIQRGITVERQAARTQRFHDLDALAGTWSAEDEAAFRAAIADFDQIDPALWP